MKKYNLDKGKEIIIYFLNNGYIDNTTMNEVINVLEYLRTRKKGNSYFVIDDLYSVIAIIDRTRETCYLYSNCGINFDLDAFFNYLLRLQNHFSAIVCDETLFSRATSYLDTDNIIFTKTKEIYSTPIKDLIPNKGLNTKDITIPGFVFEILGNLFIKPLSNNLLLFINQANAGIIRVENVDQFMNFYNIKDKDYQFQISETDKLQGMIIGYNQGVSIHDIDLSIQSLIILRNQYTGFELIYGDSIVDDIPELIKEFISNFNLDKEKILYFVSSLDLCIPYYESLGFNSTSKKVYFYYLHRRSRISYTIPEVRKDVYIKQTLLYYPFLIIFYIVVFSIFFLIKFSYREAHFDIYVAIIGVLLFLLITLPISLIKPIIVRKNEQKWLTLRFKVDNSLLISIFSALLMVMFAFYL